MTIRILCVWAIVGLTLSACTIKATTDTTTDGTTEFVSSTTGKTWWTEEGLVKQGQHAGAFVAVNYENLLQNIAKGEGEYLQSFSLILAVPSTQQQIFRDRLQEEYPRLAGINARKGEAQVRSFLAEVALLAEQS